MQLRKESLKKIRLAGIRTLTSAIPVQRCTGIAEVRVRIPASLIFSGFLFATNNNNNNNFI